MEVSLMTLSLLVTSESAAEAEVVTLNQQNGSAYVHEAVIVRPSARNTRKNLSICLSGLGCPLRPSLYEMGCE